ncbi:FkbM family methyltransferase [Flavobacterium alvei]|uniref:FkbM family methyltransferase n=1 Tax=Flavobacterium alvei TaxID=2080416 RepID=A0A2S5AFC5_9FLAO|nr:FkbM family methyltransferase [Flavobacterium alvei]POY41225.1 FkbM family methyltransferase [Flavobacterium alvei]
MKLIKKRLRNLLEYFIKNLEYRKYKFLGLSYNEFSALKKRSIKKESILFGKEIKITDSFWYLHSLKELFIDEVYKFTAKSNNPKIIDCGSNIGLSIIFFKRMYPSAEIIAFEPDNDIYKISEYNLNQFGINDVKLFQKAVWIKEEPLVFAKKGSLSGHIVRERTENTIEIKTVRLKDFLSQKIDFLKIDIEGSEYDILKDCGESLKNVDNIFVEYHSFAENPQMIGELLMILKNAGFKVYIKEAWENMKNPYEEKKGPYFDLQLNIFGYRLL